MTTTYEKMPGSETEAEEPKAEEQAEQQEPQMSAEEREEKRREQEAKQNERMIKRYKKTLEQLYRMKKISEKLGLVGDPEKDWRILHELPEKPFAWEEDGKKFKLFRNETSGFVGIIEVRPDGSAERWEIDRDGNIQRFEQKASPDGKKDHEAIEQMQTPDRFHGSPSLSSHGSEPGARKQGKLLGITKIFFEFLGGFFKSGKK